MSRFIKNKHKARLETEKAKKNPPAKRQKIQESRYISIRNTWGPPPTTVPQKIKSRNFLQENIAKKPRIERLVNIRVVEGKILEGENLDMTKYEILDWDKEMKRHKERLEKEYQERKERLEKADRKEKAWALMRECKAYLEENEKNWIKKKKERILENEKKERLEIARRKQIELKEKVKERKLEAELEQKKSELPEEERKKIEQEEERRGKWRLTLGEG